MLNNGELNGDYMMRPTSHMRLHPMTAQWHMEDTMWADAWLQARSKTAEADLIPQAAAVAEKLGIQRPASDMAYAQGVHDEEEQDGPSSSSSARSRPTRACAAASCGIEEGLFLKPRSCVLKGS